MILIDTRFRRFANYLGGYDKLPLQSKFFLNAGYQITAMSGKFHTEWGEFGGFKHPDALKYEASAMIALVQIVILVINYILMEK